MSSVSPYVQLHAQGSSAKLRPQGRVGGWAGRILFPARNVQRVTFILSNLSILFTDIPRELLIPCFLPCAATTGAQYLMFVFFRKYLPPFRAQRQLSPYRFPTDHEQSIQYTACCCIIWRLDLITRLGQVPDP